MKSNFLEVAKLGKVVGLKGELKLHIKSDFPEQFIEGKSFYLNKNQTLTIEWYNQNRGLIKFKEVYSREIASKYVNKILLTTIEETKKNCKLNKDEFFWFDIIGCEIVENDEILGKVIEVEDFGKDNYLLIKTALDNLPKTFYIPYINHYIKNVDISLKTIYTKNAKLILENS